VKTASSCRWPVFAVLVLLLAVGLGLKPREVPSPLIGKPAPAFSLPRLHQPQQQLARDDMLGKVWMLNVWASWCAPCREEHPLLVTAREAPGADRRTQLQGRPAQCGRNGCASSATPTKPASLSTPDGRVGIDYGVYGVPETFVIDKPGVIASSTSAR
jgi:cytochrome c biogenesis protein CcmG/thiol:disulfide interchange protein DsbE